MGILSKLTGFDKFSAQQNALFMHRLIGTLSAERSQELASKAVELVFIRTFGQHPGQVTELMSNAPRGVQMQFLANAAFEIGLGTCIHDSIFTKTKNPFDTAEWFSDNEMNYAISAAKKTFGIVFTWSGNDAKIDFAHMMFGDSPALDAHLQSRRSAA